MSIALIILAAGKGTRMKSDLPKVLHHIAGAPMLFHAIRAGQVLSPEKIVLVAGHGAEAVKSAAEQFEPAIDVVLQEKQLGTAHAVAQAAQVLAGFSGDAIVLYGDTPFISPDTLQRIADARKSYDVVVLGFAADDPGRYGRLVMDGDNLVEIVEFKDASETQKQIHHCNSGVICANAVTLFDLISQIGNDNASGEYYLTDVPSLARAKGMTSTAVMCDEAETLGVNSRTELAAAEAAFQARARSVALEDGITLPAPETVHFAFDTVIGRDVVIEQNVVFGPGTTVETGARIRAFSHLEGCHVSSGAIVGPYARLRPGAELAENTHVGNFVEIKNSQLHEGVKANHLTYIGDAEIGEGTNIGAGTITCNYDGVMKHQTKIGARAFIGSDTMLVAPVTVGDEAMTGTGSVITKDIPDGALAIGRAEQVNKPGLSRKLFEMLKCKKKKSDKEAK